MIYIQNLRDDLFLFQRKVHSNEIQGFVETIRSWGGPLIGFQDLVSTSLATFAVLDFLRTGNPVRIEL